jgi:hypothetical protein
MALQQYTVQLKLRDDEWKSLGRSQVKAGSVTCVEGLAEGIDFEIDYVKGFVRRRRVMSDAEQGLFTFTFTYEDGASQAAAVAGEVAAATSDLRANAQAMITRLDAVIAGNGSLTAAQVRDAVIDLAKFQKRIVRYLVAGGGT